MPTQMGGGLATIGDLGQNAFRTRRTRDKEYCRQRAPKSAFGFLNTSAGRANDVRILLWMAVWRNTLSKAKDDRVTQARHSTIRDSPMRPESQGDLICNHRTDHAGVNAYEMAFALVAIGRLGHRSHLRGAPPGYGSVRQIGLITTCRGYKNTA